ncbi:MAG: hypothetical protein NTW21_09625 [Verrucomicrobia bacterium]|nr:hypothetical protein [Verrucomicrobiota bacterium]
MQKLLALAATFSSLASVPLASAAITPPSEATLLFSTDTDSLPADGAPAGTWANYLPLGGPAFGPMGAPTVKVLDGVKWVENHRSTGDGFDRGIFDSIATSGASFVVAFKPSRGEAGDWQSLIDIGTMGLVVGVRNDSGAIVVFRKGTRYLYGGAAEIPDGQTTILSCIFQENGPFKIFANGVEIVNNTSTSDPNLPLNPIVPWYNGANSAPGRRTSIWDAPTEPAGRLKTVISAMSSFTPARYPTRTGCNWKRT